MSGFASSPPTVRFGSNGLFVAYCQNLLNRRLPGNPCWVDGIFGSETDHKVRLFQSSKGLSAEGVVGPETWAALESGPPPINSRPSIQVASVPYEVAMKEYNEKMSIWMHEGGPPPKQPVKPTASHGAAIPYEVAMKEYNERMSVWMNQGGIGPMPVQPKRSGA